MTDSPAHASVCVGVDRSLPMARVWPPSQNLVERRSQEDESQYESRLPPADVQTALVDLYFTYIHISFPVIHKARFLAQFRARLAG